jgi:S-adenosyl-L-methionine hydrolase (adenosine-forming)
MARPIVFMTDYGLGDEFVGVCHGVIARIAPDAHVIDLTHAIPRQDVLQGAVTLARAARFMPEDAVYLAVVDPGVGSERRPVAVEASSGALLVGPDNGLLSMAWEALGGASRAAEIASEEVLLHPVSRTFHGRDVFAPAAAHLSVGMALQGLGPAADPETLRRVDLPGPMVTPGVIGARIVGIDGFGNVQLNVSLDDLEAAGLGALLSVGRWIIPRVATFADVPQGAAAAIVDSQGFLAFVVNHGSAARVLGLEPGATVTLSRAPEPRRTGPVLSGVAVGVGNGVPGTGPGYGGWLRPAMTNCHTAAPARRTKRQMIVMRVNLRTPRG